MVLCFPVNFTGNCDIANIGKFATILHEVELNSKHFFFSFLLLMDRVVNFQDFEDSVTFVKFGKHFC